MDLKIETIHHGDIIELIPKNGNQSELDFEIIFNTVKEISNNKHKNLIINLININYMNSLGLKSLIKSFTLLRNNGGELYIVNISAKINQVFLLTKLNTVLNIASSTKSAIEKLNKKI